MIAPPRPPSHDELEALIKEARARQLRRRLLGAAGVAIAAALGNGYQGSLNLTTESARDLGAAIGCDFFIIGNADTVKRSPSSGDELVLCKEASALSKPYALLIVQRRNAISPERLDPIARAAWESYVSIKNSLQS